MLETVSSEISGMSPEYLLWGLLLLKTYGDEVVNSSLVGGVDEKTFRKWSCIIVDLLSELEPEYVSKYITLTYILFFNYYTDQMG